MVRPAGLLPLDEQSTKLIFGMVSTGYVDVVGPQERGRVAEHDSDTPAAAHPGAGQSLRLAG